MSQDNVIPMLGEVLHDQPADEFLHLVADSVPLNVAIVIGETEEGQLFMGGNIGAFEKLVHLMFRGNNQMQNIENHFPVYEGDS